MTTVVLQFEAPHATEEELAAQADEIRSTLAALPDVEAVEAEVEGPTRVLDPATVGMVLAAVTIPKTLIEIVKLLREQFGAKPATAATDLHRIDPSRLLVEIDGRFVRLTELTDADLAALDRR